MPICGIRADRSAYQLRCNGRRLKLERIPLKLLFLLVDRHGQIVTRREILEHVWGKGIFIDIENGINSAIRKVRRALSDDPESPRFVATIASKGYRFIAPVRSRASASLRPAQSQLVGRTFEINKLRTALGDASSGHGRIVLISGEAGVGKTRLSEEITTFAEGIGFAQFMGHCSEDLDSVPYLPFVEILEGFVDGTALPEVLRAQLGDEGPELARLLPKIKNIVQDLPAAADLPPAQGQAPIIQLLLRLRSPTHFSTTNADGSRGPSLGRRFDLVLARPPHSAPFQYAADGGWYLP